MAASVSLHFNCANLGIPLPEVVRAQQEFRLNARTPLENYEEGRKKLTAVHERLKSLWGFPEVAALAGGGATALLRTLAFLLRQEAWAQKQGRVLRVLTSPHEHSGFLEAFSPAQGFQLEGLSFEELQSPKAFAQRVKEAQPDVVFLSHVLYDLSWKLPIQSLLDQAQTVGYSGLFVVDVAQSAGIVDVLPRPLGFSSNDSKNALPILCLGSLHKWLMGPHGSGFVLANAEAAQWVRAAVSYGVPANGPLLPENPLAIFEAGGGHDFSLYAGMLAAVDAHAAEPPQQASQEKAWQLLRMLHSVFEKRQVVGVRIHSWGFPESEAGWDATALPPRESVGAMLSLDFVGAQLDAYAVYRSLIEQGESVKCVIKPARDGAESVAEYRLLRLSVHALHSTADLERLALAFDRSLLAASR